MQGGSGHHPRSSPSDESHASAARPTATALCTDVSVPYESARLHDAACKTVSAGGPLLCTDAANLLGSESLGSDRADAASTQGPQTTGSTQTGAGTAAAQEAAAGAASPATGASQHGGQYGSRAALQVRPVKRRRKAATQAAAREPASSAAAAGCQTVLQAQYAVEAALAKADAACRPSWVRSLIQLLHISTRYTMRFGGTVKVLAECKLKYYIISECARAQQMQHASPFANARRQTIGAVQAVLSLFATHHDQLHSTAGSFGLPTECSSSLRPLLMGLTLPPCL